MAHEKYERCGKCFPVTDNYLKMYFYSEVRKITNLTQKVNCYTI